MSQLVQPLFLKSVYCTCSVPGALPVHQGSQFCSLGWPRVIPNAHMHVLVLERVCRVSDL